MSELTPYREQIYIIDTAWVALLAKRFQLTAEVGALKAEKGLPACDPAREMSQMDRIAILAEAAGVKPELAQGMLRLIFDQVVADHEQLKNE